MKSGLEIMFDFSNFRMLFFVEITLTQVKSENLAEEIKELTSEC
jgi:hypothetical protein